MKVYVTFREGGLQLQLSTENAAEECMVGAVLNHPGPKEESMRWSSDQPVDPVLLKAAVRFEGHYTNQRVSGLEITVYRNEQETADK